VDKNQYDLFLETLRRLDKVGVLSKVVLIGSWCLPLYRDHYSGINVPYYDEHQLRKFKMLTPTYASRKSDIPEFLNAVQVNIKIRCVASSLSLLLAVQ
jgi:hypothetical protein